MDSLSSARKLVYNVIGHDNKLQGESGKEEGKDEKKKIAKKNEENLVENTLQIYHNTMEGVLERLDDNLDLLLGYRLLLTQLNGENNLEKVKAQYKMLQILKERCKDTKEADAYAVVNCKDNSILIQRNGNITYDTIKDIKKYLQKRNT